VDVAAADRRKNESVARARVKEEKLPGERTFLLGSAAVAVAVVAVVESVARARVK